MDRNRVELPRILDAHLRIQGGEWRCGADIDRVDLPRIPVAHLKIQAGDAPYIEIE